MKALKEGRMKGGKRKGEEERRKLHKASLNVRGHHFHQSRSGGGGGGGGG